MASSSPTSRTRISLAFFSAAAAAVRRASSREAEVSTEPSWTSCLGSGRCGQAFFG
jgi:hypothetical protein